MTRCKIREFETGHLHLTTDTNRIMFGERDFGLVVNFDGLETRESQLCCMIHCDLVSSIVETKAA